MSRRKKKSSAYNSAAQARRMARAVLGPVPAARVLPSRKKKKLKHQKRELERELEG